MSFQDIADVRRMTSAKTALATLEWDVDPDAFQRLRVDTDPDLDALLRLLARRGLDPALVATLFDVLPARPVERALVAYDVLRGALLGTGDAALATRLATEVTPIRPFATAAAAVPRDRVAALIAAVRPNDDRATWPRLGGIDQPPNEALFAHVRLLASAHLPSLALAFLQIAVDRFAVTRALEMLVDLGLDHDRLASVPQMSGQDAVAMQLQTYLLVRASLAQFDVPGAAKLVAALDQHPGVAAAANPSLLLVEAQLAILQGQRLDSSGADQVARIATAAAGWRYARAVADAVAMPEDPDGVARRLDAYITTFGNDAHAWAQAATQAEAKPALVTLLSRELRYGGHDPAVWRALGALSGDEGISAEVDLRTTTQLRTALIRSS